MLLDACSPTSVEVHPLIAYKRISLLTASNPDLFELVSQAKAQLESTDDKGRQSHIVETLCYNVVARTFAGPNIEIQKDLETLVLDKSDSTTYNIELVITEAQNLANELKDAFLSSDVETAIKKYEFVAIRITSLLRRIKGSVLYNEIVKATGIDEENIFTKLSTDDFNEGRKKITSSLDTIITFIKTHFK